MELIRRLDRGWARVEALLTGLVLMAIVLIASFSVGVRNLTRWDVGWANALLMNMEWADAFLRNATTLLAFLGASQAVHYRKHISIDVLTRVLPLKPRYVVHALSAAAAGLIAAALAASLMAAVRINMSERPVAFEVLVGAGSVHVCDATPQQLSGLIGVERPSAFCWVRAALSRVGLQAEAPAPTSQLVVPWLFAIIALRFFGMAAESAHAVWLGDAALNQLEVEEQARLAAVHEALRGPAEVQEPAP